MQARVEDEKDILALKLLTVLADCETSAAEQLKYGLDLPDWNEQDREAVQKIREEELSHGAECIKVMLETFGDSAIENIHKLVQLEIPNHFIRAFNYPLDTAYDVVAFTAVMDLSAMFIIANMGKGTYPPFQKLAKFLLASEASHFGFGWSRMRSLYEKDPAMLLRTLEKWINLALDNFGKNSDTDEAKVRLGLTKSPSKENKRSFIYSVINRISKAEVPVPPSFWGKFPEFDARLMQRQPNFEDLDIDQIIADIVPSVASASSAS